MRLRFSDRGDSEPTDAMKGMLTRAFDIMQGELGLADHDEDVELTFIEKVNMGGAAAIHAERRYPMEVDAGLAGPATIIYSLAHEMVHARDIISGALKTVGGKMIYNGVAIPNDIVNEHYSLGLATSKALPHEKPAYDLGPKIAAKVIERLSVGDLRIATLGMTHPDAGERRRLVLERFKKESEM